MRDAKKGANPKPISPRPRTEMDVEESPPAVRVCFGRDPLIYASGSRRLVAFTWPNGRRLTVKEFDGWVYIEADSTLTVRPVNERGIYVRPVGYEGPWVPSNAPVTLTAEEYRDRVGREIDRIVDRARPAKKRTRK